MPGFRSHPLGNVVRLWSVGRQFSVEEVLCYVDGDFFGDLSDAVQIGVDGSLGYFFLGKLGSNALEWRLKIQKNK